MREVFAFLALYLGSGVAAAIVMQVGGTDDEMIDLVASAIDAVVVLAFAWRVCGSLLVALEPRNLVARHWLFAAAALAVVVVGTESRFWFATMLFDELSYFEPYREQGWPLWSAFALISLAPAVFEELAFRGYLLARFGQLMLRRDAILLQAALFAIAHFSVVVLPSHFVIGLALGWLRVRTGSLLPPMAVHAAWNARVLIGEGIAAGC